MEWSRESSSTHAIHLLLLVLQFTCCCATGGSVRVSIDSFGAKGPTSNVCCVACYVFGKKKRTKNCANLVVRLGGRTTTHDTR